MSKFNNRVGENYVNKWGDKFEVIEYFGNLNCTVRFEDGTVVEKVEYRRIIAKNLKKPVDRVGEKWLSTEGDEIEIIEYLSTKNCTVRFKNGLVVKNREYRDIQRGVVKNLYRPSVYGVGYIGEGVYNYKNNIIIYSCWSGMLSRCYNEKCQEKQPTYKDVTVCEEWKCFQNFAKWHEENYNPETMQGWHLDKDILIKGNKIYSPQTCCFVPKEINYILTSSKAKRGELPIGVRKIGKKFTAFVCREGKQYNIGTFDTPDEAFQAYKTAKESYIKEVADKWKDKITEQVYQAMYNYQVEITD